MGTATPVAGAHYTDSTASQFHKPVASSPAADRLSPHDVDIFIDRAVGLTISVTQIYNPES